MGQYRLEGNSSGVRTTVVGFQYSGMGHEYNELVTGDEVNSGRPWTPHAGIFGDSVSDPSVNAIFLVLRKLKKSNSYPWV